MMQSGRRRQAAGPPSLVALPDAKSILARLKHEAKRSSLDMGAAAPDRVTLMRSRSGVALSHCGGLQRGNHIPSLYSQNIEYNVGLSTG
jgi:hypothetical protein